MPSMGRLSATAHTCMQLWTLCRSCAACYTDLSKLALPSREYKKNLVALVTVFLAAVKASLVKLGVDESRLHRIVQEVSAYNACQPRAIRHPFRETFQAYLQQISPYFLPRLLSCGSNYAHHVVLFSYKLLRIVCPA